MAEMTPGAALRQIQQAQAGLKSARKSLRLLRDDARAAPNMLKHGWERLAEAHRILASIPLTAATEPVMTKQLALQRYATALLVRLRRVARQDFSGLDGEDEDSEELDS